MEGYFVLACMVLLCFVLILHTKERSQLRESFAVTVCDITGRAAAERKDLLDRLMARDLTEVKAAQRMEVGEGPRVVSKRDNEERKAKESRKVLEGKQ